MQFRTLRGLFGVNALGRRSATAGEQHQGIVVHATIDQTGAHRVGDCKVPVRLAPLSKGRVLAAISLGGPLIALVLRLVAVVDCAGLQVSARSDCSA